MQVEVTCPVCKSNDSVFFVEKNKCSLYRCKKCELVHVFPIPDSLESVYSKDYFFSEKKEAEFGYVDYDRDKQSTKEYFNKQLDKLAGLVTGRRMFDVGAATGFFLGMARDKGWNVSGSEISTFAADEARGRGFEMFCGDLLDLPRANKYDVVTMWDVFEHVATPSDYLRHINNVLSKDGMLVINTVDIGSWYAKLRGKNWHLLIPPEHVFYYTKKNLFYLLEKNGFEVVSFSKPSKKFSLTYVFSILYQTQNFKAGKKLSDFLNTDFWRKFTIPINVRDNILVIAKKIKDV